MDKPTTIFSQDSPKSSIPSSGELSFLPPVSSAPQPNTEPPPLCAPSGQPPDQGSIELSPRQDQIARLISLGYNAVQVAEKLGMEAQSVRRITKSPLFHAVLKSFKKELDQCVVAAQNTLVDAAPLAARALVDLIESENERVRRDACNDVLRGAGAIKEEKAPKVEITINEQKLDLIFATMKEVDAQR